MPKSSRRGKARAEAEELRIRLEEAEETIAAIRSGAVDAFLVQGDGADQVLTKLVGLVKDGFGED